MHCASPINGTGSSNGSRDEDDGGSYGDNSEIHKPWITPSTLRASILSLSQAIPPDVVYKQLYQLRMTQMRQGVDLSGLSRVQWGLQQLKFSHHIVLKKSPFRCVDIPVIFRVTVCKGCCPSQDVPSIFLGVYGDQESALLVNDVHEILSGRCEKLSVLRKEDAMFFHHLTARTLDESEGVLLPASPVLSVLEKLRIDSANASLLAEAALEEKKRKRSSTIDILIESSLSLSMTSRENSSSNGEGEEDDDADEDDIEGEEEYEYNESGVYSSSSKYRNHAPFSSYTSTPSNNPIKIEISSINTSPDRFIVTAESSEIYTERERSSEKNSHHNLNSSNLSLPRTRKSNRPRASTFSVVSSAHNQSNSQNLLDNEAERTPMGLVTWLASLEDDDFVAAKLLTEMCSKEKKQDNQNNNNTNKLENGREIDMNKRDIPRYRGVRKGTPSSGQKDNHMRHGQKDTDCVEPPTQRRRRANSVIEVNRNNFFYLL